MQGKASAPAAGKTPGETFATPPTPNTDVLPLHCLQPIQEVFAQTAGIGAVTTNLAGETLTTFSNPCAFCTLILATEQGRARCRASWQKLANDNDQQPRLEKCHAGLTYARGWIHLDGAPIAMIFGGQFAVGRGRAFDAPEHVNPLARACALDPAPLRQAAHEIRVLPKPRAEHLLHLLQLVADTFSTIGQERQDLLTRLKKVAALADVTAH